MLPSTFKPFFTTCMQRWLTVELRRSGRCFLARCWLFIHAYAPPSGSTCQDWIFLPTSSALHQYLQRARHPDCHRSLQMQIFASYSNSNLLCSCRVRYVATCGGTNSTERWVTFGLRCETVKKINLANWISNRGGDKKINCGGKKINLANWIPRWWLHETRCTSSRSSTLVRSGCSGLRGTDGQSTRMFLSP